MIGIAEPTQVTATVRTLLVVSNGISSGQAKVLKANTALRFPGKETFV